MIEAVRQHLSVSTMTDESTQMETKRSPHGPIIRDSVRLSVRAIEIQDTLLGDDILKREITLS